MKIPEIKEKLQQEDILRKILQKIVAYGGALLLLPLLKLIKLKKRVVFCLLRGERIGHLAINTELFLRRLKSGNHFDKNNCYLGVIHKPCNRQLLIMFKRVFPIIENRLLFYIVKTPIIRNSEFFQELPCNSNEYHEFNNYPPVLSFTEEEEERGKKLLAQMEIGEDDWFICFHSRDSAYLNHEVTYDWSYHDYRDSDIKNYLKAAEYIVERGGFAVRMGSVVAEPLPKDRHPKIIDYAVDCRSDFMDIYLSAHCKFFLGNTAGIYLVSTISGVPTVNVNYIPLQYTPFTQNDLFIPKKLYSNEKKRFLTRKEIFSSDVCKFIHSEDYEKNGLRVVENTAEEILAVTREMYERLTGDIVYSKGDENLQKAYFSNIQPQHCCYGTPARVGISFLRENKNLLRGNRWDL